MLDALAWLDTALATFFERSTVLANLTALDALAGLAAALVSFNKKNNCLANLAILDALAGLATALASVFENSIAAAKACRNRESQKRGL